MRTPLCERLGIEFPIFAFSHCRDVVAAVSQAGGLGVLGALAFDAEELEVELVWIDERVGDRPYGLDIVIPSHQERADAEETDPAKLEDRFRSMIPQEHRDFARRLLDEHGVPELPPGAGPGSCWDGRPQRPGRSSRSRSRTKGCCSSPMRWERLQRK